MTRKKVGLDEYQKLVVNTAKGDYIKKSDEIVNWGLGVAGEAGDLAGCIKKTVFHKNDQVSGIKEDVGDTMWYLAMICNYYGWNFEEVLAENMEKLGKRYSITRNVGVWGNQPEGNPLRLYLYSFARFADIPGSVRVLPSHDRVFEGLHARIIQLGAHHAERLEKLLAACESPVTAFEVLPVLFRRKLDEHQLGFAMGEAIAHLHYLLAEGKVRRIEEGGLRRYVRC